MASEEQYAAYVERQRGLISSVLADAGARPVLFVGSGMTRRYLDGPGWLELLSQIAAKASISPSRFAFLSQRAGGDPITLGTLLSEEVHAWAFEAGRNSFPPSLFEAGSHKDNFIKFLASEVISSLSDRVLAEDANLQAEVASLRNISPHAIITTNFDTFLEQQFKDYEVIVGEQIIPLSLSITGELYKIHGTVSDPESLVLTSLDDKRFMRKRRYITSKLMTYFAEYPVFIFGYGLNDTNINSIIGDLGEALKIKGGLLENVFLVNALRT